MLILHLSTICREYRIVNADSQFTVSLGDSCKNLVLKSTIKTAKLSNLNHTFLWTQTVTRWQFCCLSLTVFMALFSTFSGSGLVNKLQACGFDGTLQQTHSHLRWAAHKLPTIGGFGGTSSGHSNYRPWQFGWHFSACWNFSLSSTQDRV